MTTTTRRRRRYRQHELMFDRSGAGWSTTYCSCGWSSQRRLEAADAHYDGDEHLGLVAYRRLQLGGAIAWEPMGRRFAGRAPAGIWAALTAHRDLLDDEAAAVVDAVAETWPGRVGRR